MVDMLLMPALRRQRQVNFSEFKASLINRVSSSQGYTVKYCLSILQGKDKRKNLTGKLIERRSNWGLCRGTNR